MGLRGGNGTRKVGAERNWGGSGEEYNDQDVGKVRRIEEGYGNGGIGADSSEEARGTEGIAGGRLGGDGTGNSSMGGIDEKQRPHISSLCMEQASFLERRQMLSLFKLPSKGVLGFHGTGSHTKCEQM